MATSSASEPIKNRDLLALKAFVTAQDETQYNNLASDLVLLDLTHSNLQQQHIEIRFHLSDTVDALRSRIHQKTGTPPSFQHLQIYSAGMILTEIPPPNNNNNNSSMDRYKLGYFGLQHGMRVHCVDTDPHSGSSRGQYENTSLVQKYVMSDEEYNQRKGTLRDWERQQKAKDHNFSLRTHARQHRELHEAQRQAKLGLPLPKGFEFNTKGQVVRVQEDKEEDKAEQEPVMVPGADSVEGMAVGMRCEVQPGGRRGRVAFVGVVPELGGGGHWVGVVFDEPVGKTNGTTKSGKAYFEAPGNNYGGFVRGKNVTVGDFPERDLFDDDDDSEDEL